MVLILFWNSSHESSKNSSPISFLDEKFKLSKVKTITDLYVKDTGRNQHLHYTSSHPNHTKWSIVHSQVLKVKRICSEEEGFEQQIHQMRSWFHKRSYRFRFFNQEKTFSKKVKIFPLSSLSILYFKRLNQKKPSLVACWQFSKKFTLTGPMFSFGGTWIKNGAQIWLKDTHREKSTVK